MSRIEIAPDVYADITECEHGGRTLTGLHILGTIDSYRIRGISLRAIHRLARPCAQCSNPATPAAPTGNPVAHEQLTRHACDTPTDFYTRIAHAHRALAAVTDKPTTELARLAGVRVGTAAAWASRARQRGLL